MIRGSSKAKLGFFIFLESSVHGFSIFREGLGMRRELGRFRGICRGTATVYEELGNDEQVDRSSTGGGLKRIT